MEIPRHSLCVRYGEQLIDPRALYSTLNNGPITSEQMVSLKQEALAIGLISLEFDHVGNIETALGNMLLLLERNPLNIEGSMLEIPEEQRYLLGYIHISPIHRVILEKIDLMREPSQRDEQFVQIEEIVDMPGKHESRSRQLDLTLQGRTRGISYRRYFGNRFEFVSMNAPGEDVNNSVNKLFTRKGKRDGYEFKKDRSLQISYFSDKQEFLLSSNEHEDVVQKIDPNRLHQVTETRRFKVDNERSLFYTPAGIENVAEVSNNVVSVQGVEASWKTQFSFDRFYNQATDWTSNPTDVDRIKENVRKAIELFNYNMEFMQIEGNNVTLG